MAAERRVASIGIAAAPGCGSARVPGGHALTVDRDLFSTGIRRGTRVAAVDRDSTRGDRHARLRQDLDYRERTIDVRRFASEIGRITGAARLFFYDSISPIVDAESIDPSIAFRASRYGKSLDGTADYLNCPFDREQYEAFVDAVLAASSVPAHIEQDERATSNPACRSKRSPGGAATLYDSAP